MSGSYTLYSFVFICIHFSQRTFARFPPFPRGLRHRSQTTAPRPGSILSRPTVYMLALLFVPALLAGCAGPPRAIDRSWVASTAHYVNGFPSGKLNSYMALPVSPTFGLNPAKWPHLDSNISSPIWASDGTTSHGASCVSARFNPHWAVWYVFGSNGLLPSNYICFR